jgi:2,4-dienoyl-CoA reductase (NADPH2)
MVKHPRITLQLGKRVDLAAIREARPDRVILATGSHQIIPDIPGVDRPEVVTAWDALLQKVELGRRVAVLGGGAVGVETAISIADRGTLSAEALKFLFKHEAEEVETLRKLVTSGTREVVLLEMLDKIAVDIGRANRWVFLKELRMLGVKMITNARVVAIDDRGVVYQKTQEEKRLEVDSVVLALGSRPNLELEKELSGAGMDTIKIGDAKRPRKLMDAIHEGFLAALEID